MDRCAGLLKDASQKQVSFFDNLVFLLERALYVAKVAAARKKSATGKIADSTRPHTYHDERRDVSLAQLGAASAIMPQAQLRVDEATLAEVAAVKAAKTKAAAVKAEAAAAKAGFEEMAIKAAAEEKKAVEGAAKEASAKAKAERVPAESAEKVDKEKAGEGRCAAVLDHPQLPALSACLCVVVMLCAAGIVFMCSW